LDETFTVTKVVPQVKRKERYSIFLDGEFAFGVHQDVLLEAGLASGDRLTQSRIDEIRLMQERRDAKDKAMRLLAVRARSEFELWQRLSKAGFSDKSIDNAVEALKRLKLVNDIEFAKMFARNRMVVKPVGEFYLRRELQQKGLSEPAINAGIEAAFTEKGEYQFAWDVAVKAKKKYAAYEDARKRVRNFLGRRGFHWDIVNDILEHWQEL